MEGGRKGKKKEGRRKEGMEGRQEGEGYVVWQFENAIYRGREGLEPRSEVSEGRSHDTWNQEARRDEW